MVMLPSFQMPRTELQQFPEFVGILILEKEKVSFASVSFVSAFRDLI